MGIEESAPNQGATGDAPADAAPWGSGPPPAQEGPVGAGAAVNQGAPGGAPETAAGAESSASGQDAFSRRPELYVGAAFAGGFAAAQILKRLGP